MVYVLAKNGVPLMPTQNYGYVRVLLKSHDAVVVRQKPFTIRLKYTTTTYTQPLVCGIDPGRTNIGVAVVTENGECVFSANADTHNNEITLDEVADAPVGAKRWTGLAHAGDDRFITACLTSVSLPLRWRTAIWSLKPTRRAITERERSLSTTL